MYKKISEHTAPEVDISFHRGSSIGAPVNEEWPRVLDVISIHPVGVVRAENRVDGQSRGHGGSKAGPCTRSTITTVVVFLKGDVVGIGFAGRPLLPAGGSNDIGESATLERHPSVGFPWTTEVDNALTGVGGASLDRATIKDVVRDIVLGVTTVGGDGTRPNGGDGASNDPNTGVLTKNEVNCTFNITVGVDLVTRLGEECVLVSVQADSIIALAASVSGESNGLRALAISILYINVVDGDVIGLNNQGAGVLVVGGAAG